MNTHKGPAGPTSRGSVVHALSLVSGWVEYGRDVKALPMVKRLAPLRARPAARLAPNPFRFPGGDLTE